ncbi:50S ribosomal protein L25 [Lutispora thermophila]|uniref:Large ribosomal subunit protein bL25 n=1 Tax=Lutispora thermophila DSM 19022 TaxID=1122184 RepID=A0A1M6H3X5_9FIRM|nr:50S ribosomal protein L25 [Lutispora thermophila]SHJ16852.1 large subunit ribosomal protein L25 [Lutispora thermophila DSM 19022]
MGIAKLEAFNRHEKGYKVRRENFVPGVIYGKGIGSIPVKFKKQDADKVIKNFGSRAKLTLVLDQKENFGFIKDTQSDIMSGKLIHMDIQVVHEEEEITHNVPLIFKGTDTLVYKKLILQSLIDEIQLKGKAKLIPDAIEFDVSGYDHVDNIMLKDIKLPEGVTYVGADDTPVAVITEIKETDEAVQSEEIE